MKRSNRNKTMVILISALAAVVLLLICVTIFSGKDNDRMQERQSVQTQSVSHSDSTNVDEQLHKISVNQQIELSGFGKDEIYCTIQSVTPYTNLQEAEITLLQLDSDISVNYDVGLDTEGILCHPNKNNPHNKKRTYYVNEKTGQLAEHCYLLLMDIEITNVKAHNDKNSWSDKNVFSLNNLPNIIIKRDDGGFDTSDDVAYFDQTGQCAVDQYPCFELNVGETKQFTIGYLVYDQSVQPLSAVGFSYVWEYPFNENNVSYWLDFYQE